MIRAKARIDDDGLLLDFEARGHAGFAPAGSDIVCAAFTVLARTAYTALAGLSGDGIVGRAGAPGDLDFEVRSMPETARERAIGISSFLVEGIVGLAREFPSEIGLTLETQRRE